MRPAILAISLSILAVGAAMSQDGREARLAVAQEYVSATVEDMDMDRLIEQMWRPVVGQVEQSGKELSEDQIDRIRTLYRHTYTQPMRDIVLDQADIMADLFTLEEITALRDFYASKEGSSVMRKLPDVLARQQPQIMQLMQSTMPTVLPKLGEIIEGR